MTSVPSQRTEAHLVCATLEPRQELWMAVLQSNTMRRTRAGLKTGVAWMVSAADRGGDGSPSRDGWRLLEVSQDSPAHTRTLETGCPTKPAIGVTTGLLASAAPPAQVGKCVIEASEACRRMAELKRQHLSIGLTGNFPASSSQSRPLRPKAIEPPPRFRKSLRQHRGPSGELVVVSHSEQNLQVLPPIPLSI